jgi:O-antigen/teichoic acid export membrane protein
MKDFIKVLSGNITAQGMGFLALLIVARNLGVASYGIFSVLLALFVVLGQIHDFGLSVSFVKLGSELKSDTQKYKSLVTTALFLRLVISLILTLFLLNFSQQISLFILDSNTYVNQVKLIIIAAPLYSLFLFFLSYFQAQQKFHFYSLTNVSLYFLRFMGTAIIAYFITSQNYSLILYIDVFIFSYAIVVGILFILLFLNHFISFQDISDLHYAKELFSLGFWAFLSALAIMLILRIDIFMLQKLSTAHAVGLYAAAFQVAMVFPLITSALFTTVFPKAKEYIEQNSIQKYIEKTLSLYKFTLPLLLLVELFAYFLFPFVYGEAYSAGTTVLLILLISFALEIFINPLISLFYLYDKAHIYFAIILLQLVLNFIGNWYLIPLYEENGAAIATTVARSVGLILIVFFSLSISKDENILTIK